jgi:hypothetical protein
MVTARKSGKKAGPGHHAPAHFLCLALISIAAAQPALAQPAPAAATAATPVPDQLALAKLLWSTMAAIDQANKTGNYSVLRDLGTPGFKANNDAGTLAAVFAGIREQRLDLSDTLLFEPNHAFAPGIVQGLLRMRGTFRMRPTGVEFDLLYGWNNGWALHAVALRPVATTLAPQRR